MSVLVEAISVIVRKVTLEEKYPGGIAGYERDCPNGTFCSDEALTRVGFMHPSHVEEFVERLEQLGFTWVRDDKFIDIAVVDQTVGLTAQCDWLEAGRFPEGFAGCWLLGTEDHWTAFPKGRTPESVIEANLRLATPDDETEFVGHEGNVSVYRDRESGKLLYSAQALRRKG